MAKHKPKAIGNNRGRPVSRGRGTGTWIWGLHSVCAALDNPQRVIRRLLATASGAETLKAPAVTAGIRTEITDGRAIEQIIGRDAVHQGVALETDLLPPLALEDVLDGGKTLMVLDQVTDPHNVGAVLRSCAAFGAGGLILQDRHAPPMTGVLTKAASGAVERVPLIRVINLVRALEAMKEAGYWRIGLAGEARDRLGHTNLPGPAALVIGAEGAGMRRLTRENCDLVVRIPMTSAMESLNVSAAAAIALYSLFTQSQISPEQRK